MDKLWSQLADAIAVYEFYTTETRRGEARGIGTDWNADIRDAAQERMNELRGKLTVNRGGA